MTARRDIPNIPDAVDPDLRRSLVRMREEMQLLLGYRGNDPAIRASTAGAIRGGGVTVIGGGGGGGGGVDPEEDLTPPPTPESFVATPGLNVIFLSWAGIGYTQGRGHKQAVIYGVQKLLSDATLPTFGDAQPVATAQNALTFYALPSDPSRRWHLWLKFETNDGVQSVSPAGGVNGATVQTGLDPSSMIAALTAAAENPAVPYGRLTLRGNLINVADDTGAYSPVFNIVTSPITQNGVTVPPGVYISSLLVANGTIGTAQIGLAAIGDAQINTLSAAKFTGGEMRVGSFLQSTNYTSGPSGVGFRINADGTAELQAAYIRGQLVAGQINTTGLSIRDAAGNVILNAGATPSIGGGVIVSGTGGLSLGELATGLEATPLVNITGTGLVFVTPASGGSPTPASHTLTANIQNIDNPVYQWLIDGVVQVGQTAATLTVPSFAPSPGAFRLVRCNVSNSAAPAINGFDTISLYSLREGSDAYNAGLDPESPVITCTSDGTPLAGQLPFAARMLVTRGSAFVTAGVTFGIVSGSISGLSGVTISPTGDIGVTGITAASGSAIFSAAITGGPTLTRTFTMKKVLAGAPGTSAPGTPGPRGSLTGYSNSVTPNIVSSNPWNGAVDNDQATILIWRMLGNAGNPPVGPTFEAHLRIGDTVTLRNASSTLSATRTWIGTTWADPGVIITGNLIVGGTIAGGTNFNLTGYGRIEGGLGYTLPTPATGVPLSRTAAFVANTSGGQDFGIVGMTNQSGVGAGVYGLNNSVTAGIGVFGRGPTGVFGAASTSGGNGVFGTSSNGVAIYGQSGTSFGLRGESNSSTGVSGVSTSGAGGFFSSTSGVGGRFSGPVAVQASGGPVVFDGTSAWARFKPNPGSPVGRAAILRNDGGSFLLGRTNNGDADGSPAGQYGLTYDLTSGLMILDSVALNNMLVAGPGSGVSSAAFSGLKPGGASTNGWLYLPVNGTTYVIPAWQL
jgi:hypothetical protein